MIKIFEPYFPQRRGKGSGIGLYIIKDYNRKYMDGKIVVNNIENGVEF